MAPPTPIVGPIVIAGYFPWRRKGVEFWDDVRRRPLLGSFDVDGHFEGYDQSAPENTRVSCQWAKDHGIS